LVNTVPNFVDYRPVFLTVQTVVVANISEWRICSGTIKGAAFQAESYLEIVLLFDL
jgi:hypothetical protein